MPAKEAKTLHGIDLDICIWNMRDPRGTTGNLKATFNLRYGDIVMVGWKVLADKNGHTFIAPSSRKGTDGRYYDDYYIHSKEARILIEDMALSVYDAYVSEKQFSDYPPEPDDEDELPF